MRFSPPVPGVSALSAAVLWLFLGLVPSGFSQTLTLHPVQAPWRLFKGTSEPPATWRDPAFQDAAWLPAAAPVWFGEAGLFGGTGTELTDMQNQYSTVYLRARFPVTNPALFESLQLQVQCDDGFIAWINGRRVAAANAPAGNPPFNALATANAAEPVRLTPFPIGDPASLLVPGDNVLTIQVLNTSLGSSDLVLVAELAGIFVPAVAPSVVAVQPLPGTVDTLDRVTVTFSEPVQGVRAEDFLVNGQSATGVEGAGTTWSFRFPQPPYGQVGISWVAAHTITDQADPPNRFDVAAPGAIWGYELIDPEGPAVASLQPPARLTVASLTQIAVSFDKAVLGLDAGDLRLNGVAARQVSGFGAGPYLFEFTPAPPGEAVLTWAEGHGITTDSSVPHSFAGGAWGYSVNPASTLPRVEITELMAENFTAYRDEDQDPEDWIELWNPSATAVELEGWSISNAGDDPDRWVFPPTRIPAGGYLVIFASGKDRRPGSTGRLHTGFKLNPNGGRVRLYGPGLPRVAVADVSYPIQGPDYSWARENNTGAWRYFKTGSPGARNATSPIRSAVQPVRFSTPRGYFATPFNLALSCDTPGAFIRYTTNGAAPTESVGFLYAGLVAIPSTRVVRAAAFAPDALPSRVDTHTYLLNQTGTRLRLPALSLVTDTNHLYGRNGIMEVSPRNTTKRGPAWERPVSAEFIRVDDNGGFQTDCGLRLQGGDYVRGQYNYRSTALPFSKYSFRLYFRGEYGPGRLEFPLFPDTTQTSFDTIVLRAGMNDHSNPYLTDEFVRGLIRDCGQPSSAGTFVHLFLNGIYKGYYNPCERVDVDFLRAYHGGGENWDVMAQFGEVREGDATAFNTLRTLANTANLNDPAKYRDIAGRLDLTNFVDYLLPLIYVDNDDWPHNNWRAARERTPGAPYRFYPWDAEWACGVVNGHAPTWNTIQNQLSSTSPPWGGTDIQRIYLGLRKSAEFRLLFADRAHRHFFNDGALTDERIRARYSVTTNRLNGVVSGFNNRIATTWIPQRRRNVLLHLERAGLLASSNAPVLSVHGGRIPTGFDLTLTNLSGAIYYTTDGTDPRPPFSNTASPAARLVNGPVVLAPPLTLRARSLEGTNWSALTEATFEANPLAPAVRITEIHYNPPGGDAFEFLELANLGALPVDVSGFSFEGITFRFPAPTPPMPSGAHWILASQSRPSDFTARYPQVQVAGWYEGSLSNGGERVAVLDLSGRVIDAVEYQDSFPWPTSPDGSGPSLELVRPEADPTDPTAWAASRVPSGSPGAPNPVPPIPTVRLNEVFASSTPTSEPDWIELVNTGTTTVSLGRWSLTDSGDPRRFVFPANASLAPGAFLRLWATPTPLMPGLTTGFALDTAGETLVLLDAATNRVDAVRYGPLVPGYTLGRAGSHATWQLTEPTPLAPNEPALLASPTSLTLNEWIANPTPGDDDWIELHNTDPSRPAGLDGLFLGTSNALQRIGTPMFVPPSGFLVLHADGSSGVDHLGFHLPAAGGALFLHDREGSELQRLTYRFQAEGVALGRIPDGIGEPLPTPGTASPGASNYLALATGPRLNEFLARGTASGDAGDWIELHNPGTLAADLSGFGLGLGNGSQPDWLFPTGSRLGAGGYLVLRGDPNLPATTNLSGTLALNLGRALDGDGGRITLFAPNGRVADSVRYGHQLADRSAGRVGENWTLLSNPTPGTANSAATALGNTGLVRLNEWLAQGLLLGGTREPDWFELYNADSLPVDLGAHLLTDDPSRAGITNHVIAPLTFLAASGHLRFFAGPDPSSAPNRVGFSLDAWGEVLRLYGPSGFLIDSVDISPAEPGVSEGRLPDGAETVLPLPGSASPGASNWQRHPDLVVNEVLAHTDPPFEDAIELLSLSDRPLDLGGWLLSNNEDTPGKVRLPTGTTLQPGSYLVLYESLFRDPGQPTPFTLNSAHGDEVWLSETDRSGKPTGRKVHASIEASANAESWGRHRTSVGWDFAPMSRPTFGKDTPGSVEEFRQGTGLANPYPRVGPVVISEIHYLPRALPTAGSPANPPVEDPRLEFLEIHNPGSLAVPLHHPSLPSLTWRLRGAVRFDFPPGRSLPPGGRAVLIPFDPAEAADLAVFTRHYSLPAGTLLFGPFAGRLANEGEEVRLERPDNPQAPPSPDPGYVPWLLVERVAYRPSFPWPSTDSDTPPGKSLQRRRSAEYANDPAHWIAASPTPGSATLAPAEDRDLDGLPDSWEAEHGLNPSDPADALLDPDGDGLTNRAEFAAGTDPQSAASRLLLELGPGTGGGLVLRFQAAAGRTYSVLQRDRGMAGPGAWRPFAQIPAETADRAITVPLGPLTNQPRFFQVITPQVVNP